MNATEGRGYDPVEQQLPAVAGQQLKLRFPVRI